MSEFTGDIQADAEPVCDDSNDCVIQNNEDVLVDMNVLRKPNTQQAIPERDDAVVTKQSGTHPDANYKKYLPAYLRYDYIDILIINHDDDYDDAIKLKNHIKQDVTFCEDKKPKVILLRDVITSSEYNHLDYAFEQTLYVFIYVTPRFCSNKVDLFKSHACLKKALESKDDNWAIVPVHACHKNSREYKLPIMLNGLRELNCNGKTFSRDVKNLLEHKSDIIHRRHVEKREQRDAYFKEHSDEILQKRMSKLQALISPAQSIWGGENKERETESRSLSKEQQQLNQLPVFVQQNQLPASVQQNQLPTIVQQNQLPASVQQNQLPVSVQQNQLPVQQNQLPMFMNLNKSCSVPAEQTLLKDSDFQPSDVCTVDSLSSQILANVTFDEDVTVDSNDNDSTFQLQKLENLYGSTPQLQKLENLYDSTLQLQKLQNLSHYQQSENLSSSFANILTVKGCLADAVEMSSISYSSPPEASGDKAIPDDISAQGRNIYAQETVNHSHVSLAYMAAQIDHHSNNLVSEGTAIDASNSVSFESTQRSNNSIDQATPPRFLNMSPQTNNEPQSSPSSNGVSQADGNSIRAGPTFIINITNATNVAIGENSRIAVHCNNTPIADDTRI